MHNIKCPFSVQGTSAFLFSYVVVHMYPFMSHADIPMGSSSVACGPMYPIVMQMLPNLNAAGPVGLQSSKVALGAYVCRENVMNV